MRHIGIIMDGNGRWAEKRSLPRCKGHLKGAEALCRAIVDFSESDIDIITFYAFSTENGKRSREEVESLMDIMTDFLSGKIDKLLFERDLNVRFIGNDDLPDKLKSVIKRLSAEHIGHKKTVVFAIGYGGIEETTAAIDKILNKRRITGDFSKVTREELFENLYTCGLPEPEAIVRYGGYRRLSNFMPLQSTYSELFFIDKLWPDYEKSDIEDILKEFGGIKRNFGGIDA